MSFVIFNGKHVKYNGKLVTSDIPGLELVRDFTSTATDLTLTQLTDEQIIAYKAELQSSGVKDGDLQTSRIMNLSGTDTGTVKLRVYPVSVDPGIPVKVYQRNNDGTWSVIYEESTLLPENGNFVITVSKFGPIAVFPGDDYLINEQGVIYNQAAEAYLAAKEN